MGVMLLVKTEQNELFHRRAKKWTCLLPTFPAFVNRLASCLWNPYFLIKHLNVSACHRSLSLNQSIVWLRAGQTVSAANFQLRYFQRLPVLLAVREQRRPLFSDRHSLAGKNNGHSTDVHFLPPKWKQLGKHLD